MCRRVTGGFLFMRTNRNESGKTGVAISNYDRMAELDLKKLNRIALEFVHGYDRHKVKTSEYVLLAIMDDVGSRLGQLAHMHSLSIGDVNRVLNVLMNRNESRRQYEKRHRVTRGIQAKRRMLTGYDEYAEWKPDDKVRD